MLKGELKYYGLLWYFGKNFPLKLSQHASCNPKERFWTAGIKVSFWMDEGGRRKDKRKTEDTRTDGRIVRHGS